MSTATIIAASGSFTATDFTWEQAQEAGCRMFRSGGAAAAVTNWRRACAIARERFEPTDPRLATSLTNYGLVLRRQGDAYEAMRHFDHALEVWDRGWRWVHVMTPPDRPDDRYDEASRKRFLALLREGRAATEAIERWDELPLDGLRRWEVERPTRPCDLRKLISAVYLIASARSR
jgi:tetratricopeptide (TPR) repeat protein